MFLEWLAGGRVGSRVFVFSKSVGLFMLVGVAVL